MRGTTRTRPRFDVFDVAGRVLLASLLVLMTYAHLRLWLDTGRLAGLGLLIEETIVVGLLITRRRARASMNTPAAWFATVIGGFGLTLVRPTDASLFGIGWPFGAIELIGSIGAIFGLLVLGRSFGLVAANRGVQVGGPYRWVRHPVYACYLLTWFAYLGENPSPRNLAVIALATAGQLLRIRYEEAVLNEDEAYQAYRERVRYRLVPFIY
jgi:protein-S-isoprenylcysteine O-methyltransferase Ste14